MAATSDFSLNKLSSLSGGQLSLVYSNSAAGDIPDGESNGKAMILPGTILGAGLSAIANTLWKGKVFDRKSGGLINKILGMRLIRAKVFGGTSWSDGKQSIIIDYLSTSLIAFFVRDEIRQVRDDLYLGKCYIRMPFGCRFNALWFALDFKV
jgi:hypothetical protein